MNSKNSSEDRRGERSFGEALLTGAGDCAPLADLVGRISRGGTLRISGVLPQAVAYLMAVLERETGVPLLLVTRGPREMEELAEDLGEIVGGRVYCFPAWETLPEDEIEPHPDILGDRLLLIDALAAARQETRGEAGSGRRMIIVTTLRALSQKIVPPGLFSRDVLSLTRGMKLPLDRLCRDLDRGGYRRVEMVEAKGEYCVRGGIVDIFPPTADFPLRLDFFGERLDSLRSFHADTQRSISEIPEARVPPFSELGLMRRHRDKVGSLIGHLPRGAMIAVHEPVACVREIEHDPPRDAFFLSPAEVIGSLSRRQRLSLSLLPQECPFSPGATALTLDFNSVEPYRSAALGSEAGKEWEQRIFGAIAQWAKEAWRILIACHNAGERRRLEEFLRKHGVRLSRGSGLYEARLSGGFIFAPARLVVLTDKEIFSRYKIRRPRRRFKGTSIVREFSELRPGDYVAHIRHGIGIYRGVKRLEKDGLEREYICIEYLDRARLYVPLEQASLVERYASLGKTPPRLDRLGGKRWQAVRGAAEKAIFDYAAEILELQAARETQPGHAFSPDTDWQREFEDAFIYEETPDQASAIEEVKRDMERPHPMDRLVCGDVGFGKTEVAMRAAFKAVMDGGQVAVLVPTTVLARQHFDTFSDRFADYPVRIEMLSRFRAAREQAEAIEGMRSGAVDIVIGTHRLLQPDVVFKELGLVIIDEEQRFGVRHKEWLKKLRMKVDILTMSATPIPRTLYMSLSGIRDMSTINTPPEDRLAIETVVREYDSELVRDAVRRELARQGQVYFVHNRIETIEGVKESLEGLVPEATFGVAHGRMADDELEEVMESFVGGKIDVLVSTTIIESGLDIPNVNTIVIDRADRFGLADLYQLRGRVGRYRHRAYAYFLYPRGAPLLDQSRKRLKAILEHTDLGSGFKIALRDLEIRGAGNILGREQHGHIAAVGFDLYCKLLRRSIAALEGREVGRIEEIEVALPFASEIPPSYVPSASQRIDFCRRMGEVAGDADLEDIASEMRDRFGPIPPQARLLIEVTRLKLRATERGISSIRLQGKKMVARRDGEEIRPGGRWPRISAAAPLDAVGEMIKAVETFR